jgi:signal transduction histidine kinase
MTVITSLTLENEMDLVLAYKKSILVASQCCHTLATQTTFATAVSEIARSLIDKTNTGNLSFAIKAVEGKYYLQAQLSCEKNTAFFASDQGFIYAGKLVPGVTFEEKGQEKIVTFKIRIPLSSGMDSSKAKEIETYFKNLPPQTPYEEVKNRNQELYLLSLEKEEILQNSLQVVELKDEFIAMAGHELKTPLTLIKAYSELAGQLKDTELNEKGRPYINMIEKQTLKMQSLIQQLLDSSKISAGSYQYRKEPVVLKEFLESIYGHAKHLLPDYNISLHLDENLPVINIDPVRVEQVLHNLLGNSGKYSEKGTSISMTCKKDENGVQIIVQDQGIGITPEDIDRIFDKFYRVNKGVESLTSLGMGLYISSSIIKAHGGELKVESRKGHGSKFYFVLPLEA